MSKFLSILGLLVISSTGLARERVKPAPEFDVTRFDGHYVRTEVSGEETVYDFLRDMAANDISVFSPESASNRDCPPDLYVIGVPNSKAYDVLLKAKPMTPNQIAEYVRRPLDDFYATGLSDENGSFDTCDRRDDNFFECQLEKLFDEYTAQKYRSKENSLYFKTWDAKKQFQERAISKKGDTLTLEMAIARSMFFGNYNRHLVTSKSHFVCQYKLAPLK